MAAGSRCINRAISNQAGATLSMMRPSVVFLPGTITACRSRLGGLATARITAESPDSLKLMLEATLWLKARAVEPQCGQGERCWAGRFAGSSRAVLHRAQATGAAMIRLPTWFHGFATLSLL